MGLLISMPFLLSVIAVYRLWDTPFTFLKWVIVGITILAWLTSEAVRNSRKMELAGEGERKVTYFWVKASMFMFVSNTAVAVYGLMKTL